MNPTDLLVLRDSVVKLSSSVAEFIRSQLNNVSQGDVETKELNSLVSYVDKEAEKQLVSTLKELVPEAGFITEESTVSQETKPIMWVIDPLDGTTNYLYKIPHFSISIALLKEGTVIFGLVYEIMSDTSFSAIRSLGAWENGIAIKANKHANSSEAMIVTGFPYTRTDKLDEKLSLLKYCILNYRGIRRMGSAALDLVYVASGRFDIYYEDSLNIWDVAAGALIAQEAGAIVTDFDGENTFLHTGAIIASNPLLHQNFQEQLSKHLC